MIGEPTFEGLAGEQIKDLPGEGLSPDNMDKDIAAAEAEPLTIEILLEGVEANDREDPTMVAFAQAVLDEHNSQQTVRRRMTGVLDPEKAPKSFNSTWGHLSGDCFNFVGLVMPRLQKVISENGTLPGATEEQAKAFAKRLVDQVPRLHNLAHDFEHILLICKEIEEKQGKSTDLEESPLVSVDDFPDSQAMEERLSSPTPVALQALWAETASLIEQSISNAFQLNRDYKQRLGQLEELPNRFEYEAGGIKDRIEFAASGGAEIFSIVEKLMHQS